MLEPVNLDGMLNMLKVNLDETRFAHTLGVCEAAVALAERYGEDKEKAYLAALLHDCARGLNYEETLAYCQENHIALDEHMKKDINPVHALIGAHMTKQCYKIEDEAVIKAIARHATGCENMTLLDKIIFVADAIEPNRAGTDVDETRQAAVRDLNEALPLALHVKTRYIRAMNGSLHPDSVRMLESLPK
ncbi:MAG: bis(5'-nucleosyl)-tetraphosphatase (symmetrical) YqeK [Defluviitaleaceae bacterium]|nr:bis(5'-nucleosyl)-tetraphosphatase (symmetrical) YqeK [Defluviitaleaceae bacterium]